MDGQMCEDVRIGIAVRIEMQKSTWRIKGQGGFGEQFGSWHVEQIGIVKFLREWEPIPHDVREAPPPTKAP